MGKSLNRVSRALADAGIAPSILHLAEGTRTAQAAADAARCVVDQIAKSIIFAGTESEKAVLFITAGGNRVDQDKASTVAGERLGKADAALIRAQTGFAIGGVAPVGHLNPIAAFFDPRLLDFPTIWAAAGTPQHIFEIDPDTLLTISGAATADFVEVSGASDR